MFGFFRSDYHELKAKHECLKIRYDLEVAENARHSAKMIFDSAIAQSNTIESLLNKFIEAGHDKPEVVVSGVTSIGCFCILIPQ